MSVLVFGLNYKTAPIDLLERVAVPAERMNKALLSVTQRAHIDEAVILSTCNRVEVYAHVTRYHGGVADVRNFLDEFNGVPAEDIAEAAYEYYDDRAALHLFTVAAGLDSMVVGERQILLQVREAFAIAQKAGATGRMLESVFRQALNVGRRARNDTGIAKGASSMVDVGLAAARRTLGPLDGRSVFLVGAGQMGGLAARQLSGIVSRITVANRSADKAQRLAQRVGAEVLSFSDLAVGLAGADLAVTSTGAPLPLVDVDTVASVMAQRPDRPLVLLDLAVPRDVDPACADVPGVTVLDIDAVRDLAQSGATGAEIAKARALVEQEAERYRGWTRAVRVEPTIAALRARAEAVRDAELRRLGNRLGDLDERQRAAVEALTRGIINRLLHEPSVRLKEIADKRGGDRHAAALRDLFDLDLDS